MYSVILSPEAEADLVEIYLVNARCGFPENAAGFIDKVWSFCQDLQTFPNRGTARSDIAPGLRTVSFNKQVNIIFEVIEKEKLVTIARIVNGRRNLEKALKHVR